MDTLVDTPAETAIPVRPSDKILSPARHAPRKSHNSHQFREEWLYSAVQLLRPMFEKAGAMIPEFGRAAIGFTSKGGKGNCVGECWHPIASADEHFEIFIRPDHAEPVEILGILTHELVHAAVPLGSGHGPVYKALATKIGLEGKMRHAMPGMHLNEVLRGIASELGPLPHAKLNIEYRESAPRKKQKTNMLKAWCEGKKDETGKVLESCDYVVRLTKTHAERGAPICGIHEQRMKVEWPVEDEGDGEATGEEPMGEGHGQPDIEPVTAPASVPELEPVEAKATPQAPIVEAPAAVQSEPVAVLKVSPVPAGFRRADPGEIHQPGHTFKVDNSTGETLVSVESEKQEE